MYWVWFSTIKGLGPIKKRALLEIYKSPKVIWGLQKNDLLKIEGIGDKLANEILDKQNKKNIDNYMKILEREKIELITFENKYYPKILKHIYDYPISLYVKGNKAILNDFCLAIIGSRFNTQYGKVVTEAISGELAKRNVNIVSGMASGIDSIAHRSCIENKGKTIAVLGSGLMEIYPPENKDLFYDIIEKGGAVISEYPVTERPLKNNFPARNRIISGISHGVIVSEAREKSGTIITIDCGLEQGKNIFAVPGNINLETSRGTNNLIKQGAKMVTNIQDILEEYKILNL
ncbi:MAG: DNA-processing protein DprA [Clostridia bacterium]|nr:DNA-processing protein DprA [Clostridia bacterium]